MRCRAVLRPKIATRQAYRLTPPCHFTPWLRAELCGPPAVGTVTDMADSALQQQLDEVRGLLNRARELFGAHPVEPPTDIAPDADAVKRWVR